MKAAVALLVLLFSLSWVWTQEGSGSGGFRDMVVDELRKMEARLVDIERLVQKKKYDWMLTMIKVEELEKDLKIRLRASEREVEELKRVNGDRPKVAFSAGLTDYGPVGPFNTATALIYSRIHTNIGQAYDPITGTFKAPLRGVYYIRFTAFEYRSSQWMGIHLTRNGKRIMWNEEYNGDTEYNTYISNALALELEEGDLVNMELPAYHGLFDDSYNYNTFSGFLLFPL